MLKTRPNIACVIVVYTFIVNHLLTDREVGSGKTADVKA